MSEKVFSGFDWRSYSIGLAVLACSLIFLIGTLYIRYSNLDELNERKMQVRAQRSMNRSAAQELLVLNHFSSDYAFNQDRGIIGDARKLDWIEKLDSLGKEIGILNIQFTLENTRKVAEGETPFYDYELGIYITEMFLDLNLLHEGDLYKLIERLSDQSMGVFSVESCEIKRIGESVSLINYEGLKAKCHFRWFNLDDVTLPWLEYENELSS